MTRSRLLLFLFVLAACKGDVRPTQKAPGAGPQLRATVITVRTTIQPSNQTFTHAVVIAGGLARSTDEHDAWRLYDTKRGSVTFVDDIDKTLRTEPLPSIVARRRAELAKQPIPSHIPRATFSSTGKQQPLQGVNAEQSVVKVGAYTRELWLAKHPNIPDSLFSMMQLSDAPSSPLAPMMRAAEEALLAARGFPMVDKAELPYGNKKFAVERVVLSIVQKDVPKSMLAVPRDYKDLTPKPAAPAKAK